MGRAQRARDTARELRAKRERAARDRVAARDEQATAVARQVYEEVVAARGRSERERLSFPATVFAPLVIAIEAIAVGWVKAHELPQTDEQVREVAAWLMHTLRDTVVLAGPAQFEDWRARMASFEELGEEAAADVEGDAAERQMQRSGEGSHGDA